jgi:hypothetical protein
MCAPARPVSVESDLAKVVFTMRIRAMEGTDVGTVVVHHSVFKAVQAQSLSSSSPATAGLFQLIMARSKAKGSKPLVSYFPQQDTSGVTLV